MRIASSNVKEYIGNRGPVTEEQLLAADEKGAWCWEMKTYRTKDDENSVTLYSLAAGCYWHISPKGTSAVKVLKTCYAVEYGLNSMGSTAYFTEEVEAIDFTMKIINLIKA